MKAKGSLLISGVLVLSLIACGDDDNWNKQRPLQATGFFGVVEADGRWWLVDPSGQPFYSIGLNHVSGGGYTDRVTGTYPPIYYLFDTQQERAEAYRKYAENCFAASYIVGHHWFEYFDDPPGGRSDGEDSNFGLVNNADEVYEDMIEVMTEVHRLAPHLQR